MILPSIKEELLQRSSELKNRIEHLKKKESTKEVRLHQRFGLTMAKVHEDELESYLSGLKHELQESTLEKLEMVCCLA